MNQFAVPRLFALNPFNLDVLPQLSHSALGIPDLPGIAEYINKLVGSQVLTPDATLEAHLRELAKLPEQAEPAVEIVSGGEAEDAEPDEGEDEEPEIEVVEEAAEAFALKTIKGALARDDRGKFARGSGAALSEEEIALGDAVAVEPLSPTTDGDCDAVGELSREQSSDPPWLTDLYTEHAAMIPPAARTPDEQREALFAVMGIRLAVRTPPDEAFALRLKQGGPRWERTTNAYEIELRSAYQDWAERTAAELSTIEDDAEFDARLDDAIEMLVATLLLMGRRRLADAHALGLAGVPSSPDGMRELADAMAANDGYLADSLGPAIGEKVRQRVGEDGLIRGDPAALGGVLGTFIARVGSYAGGYWAGIQRGFGDRVRQEPEPPRVRWLRDPRAKHCQTCLDYGDREYDDYDTMLTQTGGSYPSFQTDCNGQCRCHLEFLNKAGDWARE